MTYLEEIILRQVPSTVTTTLSRTVERIAEAMAEEILRDPVFRAQMQTLVQRAFDRTITDLGREREGER
jgi:hypothetical protein